MRVTAHLTDGTVLESRASEESEASVQEFKLFIRKLMLKGLPWHLYFEQPNGEWVCIPSTSIYYVRVSYV